jgi:hypothetical protein
MLKKKILLGFLVILFSFLLYLADVFLSCVLYPIVKSHFISVASYMGIPAWGVIMADFSPVLLLIAITCFFSSIIEKKTKLLFYASILFLIVRCIEWATYPLLIEGQKYNIKIFIFSLLMLIVGLTICVVCINIMRWVTCLCLHKQMLQSS